MIILLTSSYFDKKVKTYVQPSSSTHDLCHQLSHVTSVVTCDTFWHTIYHSIKLSHVQWPMSQVATCDRGGVTDTWMWHFVCTFLSKYDEVSRIIIKYQMGKTDKNYDINLDHIVLYLGITVMWEWQSKISILQPLSLMGGISFFFSSIFQFINHRFPFYGELRKKF